jgi:hypothetical protein
MAVFGRLAKIIKKGWSASIFHFRANQPCKAIILNYFAALTLGSFFDFLIIRS